ncbi:MAG: peptide deformylase [Cyanobacteria bacterium P01_A01_bin.123]
MTSPLTIIQLGDPRLRAQAQPITQVHLPAIQILIDDLIATAVATNGVGIAAPQVAESKRLFILASRPNLRYPHAPTMEPTAIINPRIVSQSDEIEKGWEGCLSVPGLRGLVPRHKQIAVEYVNRNGYRQCTLFTDFVARIFQHEYDHLEGKVFLDRVEKVDDLMTEQEYQQRMIQAL